MSLLDELEKLNYSYTHILSEYSQIKNKLDIECIPRSFLNVDFNGTNNTNSTNNTNYTDNTNSTVKVSKK